MEKRGLRKFWLLLCLFILLSAGVVIFAVANNQEAPPFHFNPATVKHITLRNGDIPANLEISDREQIDEIVSLLNDFKYTERKEIPPATGWSYSIDFTIGFKEVSVVFGTDYVRIYEKDGSSVIYYAPPWLLPIAGGVGRQRSGAGLGPRCRGPIWGNQIFKTINWEDAMCSKLSPKKAVLLICLFIFLVICVVYFAFFDHYTLDLSLFHFDPGEVDYIVLQCGSGGSDVVISDREEIDDAVKLLNDFRYYSRVEYPPASGWGYCIDLIGKSGSRIASIEFNSQHVYERKRDGVVRYYTLSEHFQPLVDLANGKTQSLTESS